MVEHGLGTWGTACCREQTATPGISMHGPAPVAAVQYIHRFRLFPAVFSLPDPPATSIGTSYGGPCVSSMQAVEQVATATQESWPAEERRLCLLAGLLLPLRRTVMLQKKREVPLTQVVVKESIKWKAKDGEQVALLHAAAEDFAVAHAQLLQGCGGLTMAEGLPTDAPEAVRIALGLAVRKAGSLWRVGIVLASLLKLPQAVPLGEEASASDREMDLELQPQQLQQCTEYSLLLLAAVRAYGLHAAHEWKPLLDGKQVMQLTGAKGPKVGDLTQAVVRWQLAHPQGTQEECEAWLLSEHCRK